MFELSGASGAPSSLINPPEQDGLPTPGGQFQPPTVFAYIVTHVRSGTATADGPKDLIYIVFFQHCLLLTLASLRG